MAVAQVGCNNQFTFLWDWAYSNVKLFVDNKTMNVFCCRWWFPCSQGLWFGQNSHKHHWPWCFSFSPGSKLRVHILETEILTVDGEGGDRRERENESEDGDTAMVAGGRNHSEICKLWTNARDWCIEYIRQVGVLQPSWSLETASAKIPDILKRPSSLVWPLTRFNIPSFNYTLGLNTPRFNYTLGINTTRFKYTPGLNILRFK